MKVSTSAWLAPIETAAKERDLDLAAIMAEATIPLSETGLSPRLAGVLESVEDASADTIDWIKYGQLIREALGWIDYPEPPEEVER